MKTVIFAAAMLCAAPAMASTQLERSVAHGLKQHGFDTQVETLSRDQLASLHHILHARHLSYGEKRTRAKSVLGGVHSLRGLLTGG